MGSLKEYIAEQADRLRAEESEAGRKRDEWVRAIDRLNRQIRDWLEQADPDHKFIEVEERPYQFREEGIGAYEASGLSIHLGQREVRLVPVARNVAGPLSAAGVIQVNKAYGRADLSDGLKKFLLFRVEKEPEERWKIVEQDGFRMQVLDQAAFEEAFKSLLE